MKKKSILFLCLIGLTSFMSCSDKSSAEFEVSLEGQLVKTDVNKGKWPKWMLGDNIYAIDHDISIYSSKLTSTEWQNPQIRQAWGLIEENPESAKNVLVKVRTESLTERDKADYGLLKTIVDLSTPGILKNDSLISASIAYYN